MIRGSNSVHGPGLLLLFTTIYKPPNLSELAAGQLGAQKNIISVRAVLFQSLFVRSILIPANPVKSLR